ncbi:hypothetical protein DPMN_177484, partial [Dreissena polymorpha]
MTNDKVFGRTDGLTDRQTDGLTDISYANDDDDGDENDDDDHDAAAAPPPMLLLMMMMMLIMFNITTAFEHRCRSGPLNIRTDVYTTNDYDDDDDDNCTYLVIR